MVPVHRVLEVLFHGIDNIEQQRAVFLSVVGPAPYKLLRNLTLRYKFKQRITKSGETVAAFVTELGSIAEFCNFDTSIEDLLHDEIMCGINDDGIQQKLFAEKTLTYQRALEPSQGLETAAKNVKELKIGRRELEGVVVKQEVNKVSHEKRKSKPPTVTITCYRCGTLGHLATQCKFKEAICHQCK